MHRFINGIATACLVLLGACSGIPQHVKDEALQKQYVAYAGAPVDRFTYLGRFDSWRALGDTQVIVWTTPNDAYLLTVMQPCISLPFANRIGVSSTVNTVSRGFDYVLVDRQRCQITEIRPVDYRRFMADRRKARNQESPDAH